MAATVATPIPASAPAHPFLASVGFQLSAFAIGNGEQYHALHPRGRPPFFIDRSRPPPAAPAPAAAASIHYALTPIMWAETTRLGFEANPAALPIMASLGLLLEPSQLLALVNLYEQELASRAVKLEK